MERPKSPITGSGNITHLRKISVATIISNYKKNLGINVSPYFTSHKYINLYRCEDTGYRFYFPLNTSGGSDFYEQLEKQPWYYMDWKWEYGKALPIIKDRDKILEIGCAEGSFLKRAVKRGARIVGLELNERAIQKAKKKGLFVLNEPLAAYSKKHAGEYDIICSFQVLEHVSTVNTFIGDSVRLLKKGGKLIISVPNNDSFIFNDNNIILNFPPHHMGLWDRHSLISLQNIFNIRLIDLYNEPLQKYHQGYLGIHLRNLFGLNEKRLVKIASPLLNKFVSFITPRLAVRLSDYLIGHSVMAIYIKL